MRKIGIIAIIIAIIMLLIGCADATPYTLLNATTEPYGFWGGVWHGMILVPDFIGSLIWDDVAVYAVNNNGAWYDFGFIGGFGFVLRFVVGFIRGVFSELANK